MIFTFSLSLGALLLIAFSVLLFIGATWLFWWMGLFDNYIGDFEVGVVLALYAIVWMLPSTLAWGVWAMWFRSAA